MDNSKIVKKTILGKEMYMRESHRLPFYLDNFKLYDRALPRISKAIKEIEGHLTFVDIGANIGDTVELVTMKAEGKFLCIEGDKDFCDILKMNCKENLNVELEESFCGETDETCNDIVLDKSGGTGKLENIKTGENKLVFKKLDTIIKEHKKFDKANLVKIDTDGFEISILKGSEFVLREIHPALFLEFTPNYFIEKKQNPTEFFDILYKNKYKKALIYDNFGFPLKVIDTNDLDSINKLISQIDHSEIYYYDIFTMHESNEKDFKEICDKEIFEVIHILKLELNTLINQIKTGANNQYKEKLNDFPDKFILLSIEKEKLRKEISEKTVYYENIINKLNNELVEIKKSKGWRMLLKLRKISSLLFPLDGYVRKSTYLFRKVFKRLLFSKRSVGKVNSKRNFTVNNNSKKILYIGHSYHSKTKSTQFLVDYLKESYDVEVVLDNSWQGDPYPDLNFVDEKYLAVIFFQQLPSIEVLNSIKNENIIFFPMFDSYSFLDFNYWKNLENIKIINFSSTVHKQLLEWGLNSIYVQYFPEPKDFIPGNKNEIFFWQRVESINFNTLKKVLGKNKDFKVHIHKATDPSNNFYQPNKADEVKYSITYSSWFEKQSEFLDLVKSKSIYFAPRVTEGIGQSFLEAMAMGKAVIAPNNPTMNEYITHNINGYLYDFKNPMPIDLGSISEVQSNAFEYIKQGSVDWSKNKLRIIEFISKSKL